MSGEIVESSDRDNETSEMGWESLVSDREDGEHSAMSWDDLKNVEMASAEKSVPVEVEEIATPLANEKEPVASTLEQLVKDAQEAKRPVKEMSDHDVVLEYLGVMDDLSSDFLKGDSNSLLAWQSGNFTKGALDEVKAIHDVEQADSHYLQRSQELGMANVVIGSLAQIQRGLSEMAKKNDQRIGLEAEIHTLEDKLNNAGFFDRLFSPDRRTLKELREKEDALEQNMDIMKRVIEGDKASLYETLKTAYGEEQLNDEDDEAHRPDNNQVENRENQDVFESDLYQRFTSGERGEKVERAVELYNKLGNSSRRWHQIL